MATNDGNRTNLASSKIQTSRSLSYWFERIRALLASLVEELPMGIWPLVGYRKKENGFANMYNIVEIRNFKPTVSE